METDPPGMLGSKFKDSNFEKLKTHQGAQRQQVQVQLKKEKLTKLKKLNYN
jgi:hypothetical protein